MIHLHFHQILLAKHQLNSLTSLFWNLLLISNCWENGNYCIFFYCVFRWILPISYQRQDQASLTSTSFWYQKVTVCSSIFLQFAPFLPKKILSCYLLISLTFPSRAVLTAMQHHKSYSLRAAPQTPWCSSVLITCLQNWMRATGGEQLLCMNTDRRCEVNIPSVRLEIRTSLKKTCTLWQSHTGQWFQCRWWHDSTLATQMICIGVQLVRITRWTGTGVWEGVWLVCRQLSCMQAS